MIPSPTTLIDSAIEQADLAASDAASPLTPKRLRRLTATLELLRSLFCPPVSDDDTADPAATRMEWEGHIGRRAITIATVERLREALADLAADLPTGGYADRAQSLLPWVDRLAELAALPADPTCDYAADFTGDVVRLRPENYRQQTPPPRGGSIV